jgi:hypothetical protein
MNSVFKSLFIKLFLLEGSLKKLPSFLPHPGFLSLTRVSDSFFYVNDRNTSSIVRKKLPFLK